MNLVSPPDIETQRSFWNDWNARFREEGMRLPPPNERQAETILSWVRAQPKRPLDIVEIGCGSGWMSARLTEFGAVRAIDLADEVIARARGRYPGVEFIAGDFLTLPMPESSADVVVSLEALAHVPDQRRMVDRAADLLRGDGLLMIATQNRKILDQLYDGKERSARAVSNWLTAHELRELLQPRFDVQVLTSLHPMGHRGALRLLNSPRLEHVMSALGLSYHWLAAREGWLLGHTLVALARKRQPPAEGS